MKERIRQNGVAAIRRTSFEVQSIRRGMGYKTASSTLRVTCLLIPGTYRPRGLNVEIGEKVLLDTASPARRALHLDAAHFEAYVVRFRTATVASLARPTLGFGKLTDSFREPFGDRLASRGVLGSLLCKFGESVLV
jgi:hypothetical protein